MHRHRICFARDDRVEQSRARLIPKRKCSGPIGAARAVRLLGDSNGGENRLERNHRDIERAPWIRRLCEWKVARVESDADHAKRSRNPGVCDAILSAFACDVAAEHRAGGIEQHHHRAGNWLPARAVAHGAAHDLSRERAGDGRGQYRRDRRTPDDASARIHASSSESRASSSGQ